MSTEAGAGVANVAMVGSQTPLGEKLRQQLAEVKFPLHDLTCMGVDEEVGAIIEWDGAARVVTAIDGDLLEKMDLLFVCSRGAEAREATAAVRRGRGFVIDLVDAVSGTGGVAVNMEVNGTDLPAAGPARICSPHPTVQVISALMARLSTRSALARLNLTVMTPASDIGEPAVKELFHQTTAVLNFESRPEAVYQRQMAFNVIPHALMHIQKGWPDLDARLQRELGQVLGLNADAVSVRALMVPVFHGMGLLASAQLEKPLPVKERAVILKKKPFAYGPQTPAELAESDAIHVMDLGDEANGDIALWAVTNNQQGGSVANAVRIAEELVGRMGSRS